MARIDPRGVLGMRHADAHGPPPSAASEAGHPSVQSVALDAVHASPAATACKRGAAAGLRGSIRFALLLPVVLVGLTGIAFHTHADYSSALETLRARYDSRVRILASTIAAVIETRSSDPSDATLAAVVAQLGAIKHVACVAVLRRDPPEVLACSDPALRGRPLRVRPAAPETGIVARLRIAASDAGKHRGSGAAFEYVRPVALTAGAGGPRDDGLIYVLHDLTQPIAEARAAVWRGAAVLLTVFIGTTALLFVMLHFAVLAPITQINRTIARRRAGDATAYVPLHRSTELGRLTRNFNEMLVAADARERELSKLALVASRTENAIIITDAAGRIEWINEGFTRMTGFALADVRGRRPGALLQGPNTDPAVVALIRDRLAAGLGFNAELVNYDRAGREYTVSIECQPLRDAAGRVTGFMAIENNITERVAAYRALRASESKFRSLVESIPGAVYRCRFDQTRTMIHLSEAFAELSGYATSDLLDDAARTFASLIHPEDVAYVEFVIRDALARRAPYALEYRLLTAAGERRWVHDRGRAAFDGDGRVVHLDGVIIDITERKRVEEELRDARRAAEGADRAKSQFLANVSHEIRTPMTAILGYAELLLESERFRRTAPLPDPRADDDDPREALQTILRNGEHLLSIVNDILDLSKIEAGRFEVSNLECDPRALIENVAADLRERAAAKRLILDIAFEGPLPRRIRTDPLRLRQILINLVGNAIKFTACGGVRLALRCRPTPDGEVCEYDVTDTGPGIEPGMIDRLFQPFSQADPSTVRRHGGTGLGLCISRRFAHALGGDITVESRVGVGSTFRVAIPAVACAEPAPHAPRTEVQAPAADDAAGPTVLPPRSDPAAPPSGPNALAGVRLLLAEDGSDNRRLITRVLQRAGASVVSVADGQRAYDAAVAAVAENRPYDLILMDMQMPVLDGYGATAALRRTGYAGPIVALTAHAMSTDRERCLAAGCTEYATKPIDRATLIHTITTVIAAALAPTTAPTVRSADAAHVAGGVPLTD